MIDVVSLLDSVVSVLVIIVTYVVGRRHGRRVERGVRVNPAYVDPLPATEIWIPPASMEEEVER